MRYRAAVFDFDGTLVDTREPILLGLKHALAARGRTAPPDAEILRNVGFGLHEVLARLIGPATPEEIEGIAAAYRARFDEVAPGRTRLFDGMREVLEGLKGAGVRLAIATNRGRQSLEPMLEEHGLTRVFDLWLSAACVPFPKPHPLMLERALRTLGVAYDRALMVGDTTVDVQMGRAAGVDTCAVTYGAHTEDELRREGPTHVARRVAEIPEAWR
ncbi:MAG TPA: HAD family hydrolase [Planctomycetota bacterium]|nr:HAD family hydrolase [Planctomycetota bacterium]